MRKNYSVSFEDMNHENWALGKQNYEEKMASYKHCNQCRRIYIPSNYKIKNKTLETLKKIKIHGHFEMKFKFNSYCDIKGHRNSGITIK